MLSQPFGNLIKIMQRYLGNDEGAAMRGERHGGVSLPTRTSGVPLCGAVVFWQSERVRAQSPHLRRRRIPSKVNEPAPLACAEL